MKKQVIIILGAVIMGVFLWSCNKNNSTEYSADLKQSINQSAYKLNNAMASISATNAFSIFTVNDGDLKSATVADSLYKVYIPLDSIKGVYDYKPVQKNHHHQWDWSIIKYFTRTADDNKMIVNMPLKKVRSPKSLRKFNQSDTALINNFSISVSDYHNNYNSYWDYDYNLVSQISVDSAVAGNLNIKSIVSPSNGTDYFSEYAFEGGYTARYLYKSGDTTESSFTILDGSTILYQELLLRVKNDTLKWGHERQYILTIGNVKIVRKSGAKSVEIYVNNVLQPDATIEIVDREHDEEASVCKKRDVLITFEDGTSTTLSALIGESVDDIKTLYTSLHQVYFAAYVVDWIAYDIYYNRN